MRTSRFKRVLGLSLAAASATGDGARRHCSRLQCIQPTRNVYRRHRGGRFRHHPVVHERLLRARPDAQGGRLAHLQHPGPAEPDRGRSPSPVDANCGSQVYVGSNPTGNQKISPNGIGRGVRPSSAPSPVRIPATPPPTVPRATCTVAIDIARVVRWTAGHRSARQRDIPVLRVRARRGHVGQPEPAGSGHDDAAEPARHLQLRDHELEPAARWWYGPDPAVHARKPVPVRARSSSRTCSTGFDPNTVSNANCPANKDTMEENTGTDLYTPNPLDPSGTNSAIYQNAIVPYSGRQVRLPGDQLHQPDARRPRCVCVPVA